MGSKARKAKNPIGCLADRCKSGVPINMVWWNRVTENNLQVKIILLDIFESEYFGCFLCLCGVVGMRLDGLADTPRIFGFFFSSFMKLRLGAHELNDFVNGFFGLSLLVVYFPILSLNVVFPFWILLTVKFIFNTQSSSGCFIKKS